MNRDTHTHRHSFAPRVTEGSTPPPSAVDGPEPDERALRSLLTGLDTTGGQESGEPDTTPFGVSGPLVLTVEDVAALLKMSRSAAYEAINRGDLPSRRLGRRILVPVPLLREWLGLGPS